MTGEDEAFVSRGALPPEPLPAAPLCVELLLLDEDESTMHEERRSSAKGLVANLQRQIEDTTSHLCRKSAFGSLILRGAFVRVIGYEQVACPQKVRWSEPSFDVEPTVTWSRPGVVPSRGAREESPVAKAALPRLSVPKPSAGPLTLPTDGLGLITALLSWVPSCGSTSLCRSSSSETIRGCDVLLPEAQPTLAQALDGWPLCVPEAYVAFVNTTRKQVAPHSRSPSTGPADLPDLQAFSCDFQKAAVELDDDELVLLCPAPLKYANHSASSGSRTPSTAATTAEAPLWPGPSRLLCRRAGISRVRSLRPAEVAQLPTPFPHVVELNCSPQAVDGPLHVLVAFPCAKVAQRFREAAGEAVKPTRATEDSRHRGAVRCELRINARVELDSHLARQNCIAVVRRGICEACHVSAERVSIQRLWSEPPNFRQE